jgi:hypothetical protein
MNTEKRSTRPRLVAVNRCQMVMRAIEVERLIEEDHPARSIWQLVGRLDLSKYYAQIGLAQTCRPMSAIWLPGETREPGAKRGSHRLLAWGVCDLPKGLDWLIRTSPGEGKPGPLTTFSGIRWLAFLNDGRLP